MTGYIEFQVTAPRALFTDPIIGTGGGRCTLPVPTYEALKGLCGSIYREPSFEWVVEAVRIMNPVRTESMAVTRRTCHGIALDCFLCDVRYQVRARFVPSERQGAQRFDVGRILGIARRSLRRGGRREMYLGVSSCICAAEECRFGEGRGCYDSTTEDMGLMYHGLDYKENGSVRARVFRCVMRGGVIRFPAPCQCRLSSVIREGALHEVV